MNTQYNVYETTNNFSTRTIVNFPSLSTDSLRELIDTLNFKMGISELHFCQEAFKHNKFNNPTINELKIIDRVFYDCTKRPSSHLVASFMTNNALVAETYADLMARRHSVFPDYTLPCSISEMLNILPKYLGQKDCCKIALFGGKHKDEELTASGCKKIAETPNCSAGIKVKEQSSAAITSGDTVYAILNSFNRNDEFHEALNKLLASGDMIKHSKKTVFFSHESIITVIASLGFGIKLNTVWFNGKDGCISPFEPLAEGDTGVIAVFNKPESVDMLLTAQLLGLTVVPLGSVNSSRTIEGISQSGEHLALNVDFLRSLNFSRAITGKADDKTPNISDLENSVFINVNGDKYKMNSAVCGGSNYYMAGFNSVLYSYSLCIASGSKPTAVFGTYTLPLHHVGETTIGNNIELFLGAYRAECELGLSESNPKIENGEEPSLCFNTLAQSVNGIPSKFIGKGSKIYYLEPIYEKNGLPNFDNLRQMHSYIRSLVAGGTVLSILPTTDNIGNVLSKMNENVNVNLKDDLPVSRYGGFIIESVENIQGTVIGTAGEL